jgi:hypothetical protein
LEHVKDRVRELGLFDELRCSICGVGINSTGDAVPSMTLAFKVISSMEGSTQAVDDGGDAQL